MLIWANKTEVNTEILKPIEVMWCEYLGLENLREELKAWELSIIFRQIQEHFGERKDISILDFGTGRDPFSAYLNHIGYQFVTCLDLKGGWHPEITQETYNEKYNACVRYIKTDITQGYDGRHDVIFSASVLEHIEDKRLRVVQILSRKLNSGGLFIHIVDYDDGIDFKKLIDNCGVPISYKPEETPGCKEFKNPPEYAWFNKRRRSRVAFFNEREST